jgi:hypothetical protein
VGGGLTAAQDFFEEIEDLKYRFAEATKKCAAYDRHMESCRSR